MATMFPTIGSQTGANPNQLLSCEYGENRGYFWPDDEKKHENEEHPFPITIEGCSIFFRDDDSDYESDFDDFEAFGSRCLICGSTAMCQCCPNCQKKSCFCRINTVYYFNGFSRVEKGKIRRMYTSQECAEYTRRTEQQYREFRQGKRLVPQVVFKNISDIFGNYMKKPFSVKNVPYAGYSCTPTNRNHRRAYVVRYIVELKTKSTDPVKISQAIMANQELGWFSNGDQCYLPYMWDLDRCNTFHHGHAVSMSVDIPEISVSWDQYVQIVGLEIATGVRKRGGFTLERAQKSKVNITDRKIRTLYPIMEDPTAL